MCGEEKEEDAIAILMKFARIKTLNSQKLHSIYKNSLTDLQVSGSASKWVFDSSYIYNNFISFPLVMKNITCVCQECGKKKLCLIVRV